MYKSHLLEREERRKLYQAVEVAKDDGGRKETNVPGILSEEPQELHDLGAKHEDQFRA